MLATAAMMISQTDVFDNKENWCPVYVASEDQPTHVESCDGPESAGPLSSPISTSPEQVEAELGFTPSPCHRVLQDVTDTTQVDNTPRFTFRCRLRSFPSTLISPPHPADPLLTCPSTHPQPSAQPIITNGSGIPSDQSAIEHSEAGPSISALQDSLVACSIESCTHETYSTLSKRRFGFDTSLSNIQYGYTKSKPYRFTSPLSPDPKTRKRSKLRRYKLKSAPASLLQRTLRRNHADALRKRFPLRPSSPPNPDAIPYLDDDDDEFDDDEDDEIIDDFDDNGDAQVDDIVDMYNQRSPEQDVCQFSVKRGPETDAAVAEELICLSSTMMVDPTLEPVTLKPVLEETGAFVFVAHDSDF